MPYKKVKIPDRVGDFFKKHYLTPIKYLGTDKHYKHVFEWKCECGVLKKARYNNVIYGKTFSCGCKKKKWNSKRNRIDPVEFTVKKYIIGMKRSERNLKVDLTFDEVKKLIFSKCYYCKTKESNTTKTSYGLEVKHNGIDRLNSSKGYIQQNCVPCCSTCNVMKGTMSVDEFKNHIKKLYRELLR